MAVADLRTLIALRGLTVSSLARASGISRATIQAILSGRRPARPTTVRAIARALGVEYMELRPLVPVRAYGARRTAP